VSLKHTVASNRAQSKRPSLKNLPYFKFLKEQKEIFQNILKIFNVNNVSKINLKNPIKGFFNEFKIMITCNVSLNK
jgi:hypothetical protein